MPSKDNVEDIQIEHIGKVDGPRIRNLKVTNKTTNSITVEVETANAEGATYTYYYKEDGEVDWKRAEEIKEITYTFRGLESNVIYNIKVRVEKDGKAVEKEVSTITGELPEGAVQFSPVEWKSGQASTTITTSETGYTLQYQIGGITEGSWTNTTSGSVIGNLQHGQIVYGRLFDGTNGSKTANIDVQDLEEPKVNVTAGEITTNSITVSVGSSDEQWGMPTTPTYNYYIKKSTEANYQETANYTGTNTSYTFTGLTQGTRYDVKITTQDKAGNIGTGTLINKTTTKLPGGESALEQGTITFGNVTWNNKIASVTINTSTSYNIQYQINGITENNWRNISNGGLIENLKDKDVVYARLTDGTNFGDYASCDINAILVNTITLNTTSAKIEKGKTIQLVATISPNNATDKSVTWTSSNNNTATVNGNGLVTGKESGTTTITVKSNDGSNKSATCTITVQATKTLNNVPASTSSTASVIYLKEKDSYIPYIVLKHNYENSGRTLVVRNYIIDENTEGFVSGSENTDWTQFTSFAGGSADVRLNEEFYNSLDANLKSQITEVNIPYTKNGSSGKIARKVFMLSATEVGFSSVSYKEGTVLPYFSSNKNRIALCDDGSSRDYFTRTPSSFDGGVGDAYVVDNNGTMKDYAMSTAEGYRPAFTLPSNFVLTEENIQYSEDVLNWDKGKKTAISNGLTWTITDNYTDDYGNNKGTVALLMELNKYALTAKTNVIIPGTIEGYPVAIGDDAFAGCDWIKTVEIQQGVVNMESGVFEGCTSLTNININSNVITSIGDSTFRKCTSLTTINLNNMTNLKVIDRRAFEGCTSLKNIYMDKCTNIETIDRYAFGGGSYLMCPGSVIYVSDSRVKDLFVDGTNYSSAYTTITIK